MDEADSQVVRSPKTHISELIKSGLTWVYFPKKASQSPRWLTSGWAEPIGSLLCHSAGIFVSCDYCGTLQGPLTLIMGTLSSSISVPLHDHYMAACSCAYN